jgi:CubicO group peptidase (beta-lactamase class C family)
MYKMLTAVAALQLVQAGTLRLDAPLGTYLPDYPNAEVASTVTPHHLLTHTGGTGDIFGPEFTARRSELRTTGDYLRLYGARGPRFAPGTRWEYSNYGFLLLGALVERAAGTSYEGHVAARVLAPAGMTATGSVPEDSLVPGGRSATRGGWCPARSRRTRRRCPTAARPRGAGTRPSGTSRASPPRSGSTDSSTPRTRRSSSPGRSRPATADGTRTGSPTASSAAGGSSGTAGARRG